MSTFIFFVKIELPAGQNFLATYVVETNREDVETAHNEYIKKIENEYPLAQFPHRSILKTVSITKPPVGNVFGMFLNGHRQGEVE